MKGFPRDEKKRCHDFDHVPKFSFAASIPFKFRAFLSSQQQYRAKHQRHTWGTRWPETLSTGCLCQIDPGIEFSLGQCHVFILWMHQCQARIVTPGWIYCNSVNRWDSFRNRWSQKLDAPKIQWALRFPCTGFGYSISIYVSICIPLYPDDIPIEW